MEEKPVQRSNWLGVASIVLGVCGMLIFFLFITRFIRGMTPLIIALIIGLIGLVVGITSFRREGRKTRLAVLGIIISALAMFSVLLFSLWAWIMIADGLNHPMP